MPLATFTLDEERLLGSKLQYALVGRGDIFINLNILKSFLEGIGFQGGFKLRRLLNNDVLILSNKEEEYLRFFNHIKFYVSKWSPEYSPHQDCSVVPLWVTFSKLPTHFINPVALFTIASTIGKPLLMDFQTANLIRTNEARCCIEIDLAKPLPSQINIRIGPRDLVLPCKFENVPGFCEQCHKLGPDDSFLNQAQAIELEDIETIRDSEENYIEDADFLLSMGIIALLSEEYSGKISTKLAHKGSSSPYYKDLEDFSDCIDACGLTAPPFTGGIFTWSGTRTKGKLWRSNYWAHSPRTGGMTGFASKLKGLKPVLAHWSKNHFGNIFEEVKDNEIKAARAQEDFENDPTEEKRAQANLASANLILSLNKEVDFWKQKANIKWIDNQLICSLPSEAEIYKVIMNLNPDSAAGPDGFNGYFFRICWKIIKVDVILACQEFFLGFPVPRSFGSTFITLIPKIEDPKGFGDYRPISLSSFMRKINTKILATRLATLLPKFISEEQTGFQKNKGVEEQILLAEEMVHMLDKEVRGDNCIVKLDMEKAFDRVEWSYLIKILDKLGFNLHSQKLLMANLVGSHLSILINGSPVGFFQMKRGVKQGDPLSPLLFLINSEGFTRMINLHMNSTYLGSYNTGNHPLISHLAFADDLVVFLNGDTRNLKKFRRILEDYQKGPGQQVNLNKSSFYTGKKVNQTKIASMFRSLCMDHGTLPFTYLGATMVKGKLRKQHCSKLLNHFDRYLNSWFSTTLNPMGRLVLIKHVLSSIPLHITAVHTIPQSIIQILHRKMANFIWGFKNGKPKYHWSKWNNLCVPTNEGGLNLRSLEDLQEAYSIKLWWKFQTDNTKWAKFMRIKYLRQSDLKERIYDSPTWKRICRINTTAREHTSEEGDHISWVSICHLYKNNEETIDHVFLQCNWSQNLWHFFAEAVEGPRSRQSLTLNQHVMEWNLSHRRRTLKGQLRIILPGIIVWHIWKEYNRIIHDNGFININKVRYKILNTLKDWSWKNRRKKWMLRDNNPANLGFNFFFLSGKELKGRVPALQIDPQRNGECSYRRGEG
ncbi:unnamed protein product [Cuscuta campestris]|uniref:Reverse transcriptase domain-containing protein n=1 Tax=Cuscuta campestris TaxID=132261 RepID=A0A484LIC3_9ASTE|nr:unnamed protein product [Cuscuta campestris]